MTCCCLPKDMIVYQCQSCFVSKETTDVAVTRRRFGPTKYDNVGTFE